MFSEPQGQTGSGGGVKTAHTHARTHTEHTTGMRRVLNYSRVDKNPDLVTFQSVKEKVSLSVEPPGSNRRKPLRILTVQASQLPIGGNNSGPL